MSRIQRWIHSTGASNDSCGKNNLLRSVDRVRRVVDRRLERDPGCGRSVKDDLGHVVASENYEITSAGCEVEVTRLGVAPRPSLY